MKKIITNKDQTTFIDCDVFKDLFLVGSLDEETNQEIIKRFLSCSVIKGTEVERLKMFKVVLNKMMVGLYAEIQDQIDGLTSAQEQLKDMFLDGIGEGVYVSQSSLQDSGIVTKQTIRNNKDKFVVNSSGVHLKSFLKWLKFYAPKKYDLYKKGSVKQK